MTQQRLKKTLVFFLSLTLLLPVTLSTLPIGVIVDGHTRNSSDNPVLNIVIEWDDDDSKDRPDEVTIPLTMDGEKAFKEVTIKKSDSEDDDNDTWRKTIELATRTDLFPSASGNDDAESENREDEEPDDEGIKQAIEKISVLGELDIPGYDFDADSDDGEIRIHFRLKKDQEEDTGSNDVNDPDTGEKENNKIDNGSTSNAGSGTTAETGSGSTDDAGTASTEDAGKGITDDTRAASTASAGKDSTDDAATASTADSGDDGKGNNSKTDSGNASSARKEETDTHNDSENRGASDGTVSGNQGKSDGTTGEEGTQAPTATRRITVTVTWDDSDNADAIRPASVTVRLLANGKETTAAKITDGDGWKHIFTGLPVSNSNKKIYYTVTEDAVSGYIAELNGFSITNTHKTKEDGTNNQTQQGQKDQKTTGTTSSAATKASDSASETISITVRKTWNDNNDSDHLRPESITVRLKANNNETASAKITKNDGWKYTFTNLAKTDKDGIALNYTITEDAVSGYTASYNGYTIMNTHTTQKSSSSSNASGKTSESAVKTDSNAQTGDTTKITLYIILLVIAVGGCTGCAVYMHKRKKTSNKSSSRKPSGK